MRKTIAMILAGGKGERLNVLAQKRAKPAVPFGGMYRIIDFTLSNVINSGISNVGILTQYKPLSLMEHIGLGASWDLIGRSRGAFILPPKTGEKDSDWYRGTADAILQNLDFIDRFSPHRVLILSGDHIYSMDYARMVKSHIDNEADLTIAVMQVPMKDAHRFGVAITNEEDRIVDFEEKPQEPKSNLASMGIYVFNTDRLKERLTQRIGTDFGQDIIPHMIRNDRVFAYRFDGYWKDVGTLRSYWDANMDLLDADSGMDILNFKVRTNITAYYPGDHPPVKLGPSANVKNSLVAPGAVVEGKVTHSIISPRVEIGPGTAIRDSIIMEGCHIGSDCVIDNCIIDKMAVIGDGAVVGHGDSSIINKRFPKHAETGITVVGKEAQIPPGTRIGRNVIVFPDTKIKDFQGDVPSGETVEPQKKGN